MKTIKGWFHWLNLQIEWIKSFVQEPAIIGSQPKASSKRLGSLAVIGAFLYSYIKVSMANKTITDIPMNWAIMIAAILGLNILDWYIKKTVNTPNKTSEKENATN